MIQWIQDAKEWVTDRMQERTTLDGAVLIAVGVIALMFSGLVNWAAYAAILYGIWTLVKSEWQIMLGIFSGAKMIFIGVILTAVLGGFLYVKGLQKDLAVAKENMIKMEQAISDQKKLIEQQKIDFEAIIRANKELVEQQNKLAEEYKSLDKKFD